VSVWNELNDIRIRSSDRLLWRK